MPQSLISKEDKNAATTQSEHSLTKPEGRTVRIECKMIGSDITKVYMYWYRKEENKAMEHILYFRNPTTTWNAEKFRNGFAAWKNREKNSCILTITNPVVKEIDTYFCAAWDTMFEEG
ncbi:hypothetical protein XELAEV_18031264mg [Xenopus laevis]|uniref:Ig-like domain-containing protein n=1 Tax=Xenopus laevis TaxID=8355 RepID=A0A974CPL7_XENLA|nr:hypothetical protein XELAEV_18031264mg [Xenopus laevis]